jgi:hypothetical protein
MGEWQCGRGADIVSMPVRTLLVRIWMSSAAINMVGLRAGQHRDSPDVAIRAGQCDLGDLLVGYGRIRRLAISALGGGGFAD